jgi:outer membrane immunogenic protein
MRKIAILAALAAFAATPAHAAGEGRAEIQLGYDSVEGETGVSYGGVIGYDFDVSESVFVGGEVGIADSTVGGGGVEAGRDLSADLRIGVRVGENGKAYALVGYTNERFTAAGLGGANFDGVRLGAGYEHNITSSLYGKIEYRYSNYELGFDRHTAIAGVGVHF